MDRKSLACELARARADELVEMKNAFEKMNSCLDKLLKAQLELLSVVEENAERIFAMTSEISDDRRLPHDRGLSFGALLEVAMKTLNDNQ
ncbi:hypothetical protein P3T76_009934 [Phytophthora citrophthora]|uniref:Uncharacterized protein n=1 Tax=Phytophthora citrophthora TaxID=4793 RepID=A0AAD9GF76_9STRA|nr:hypothetical protein P3T76_009934 [Phytophthora citrophthora]